MPEELSLQVTLAIPRALTRGELLIATVRVCNTGGEPAAVSARLNLVESDLRVHLTRPDGGRDTLTGTVMSDSELRQAVLAPGECLSAPVQLHYTNRGFALADPGTYALQAEYDAGGGRLFLSEPVEITLRAEKTAPERALSGLTLAPAFGRGLASGEAGGDPEAMLGLEKLAATFAESSAGRAASLILANTRAAEKRGVAVIDDALDAVAAASSEAEAAWLALAVAPPGKAARAPIIQALGRRLAGAGDPPELAAVKKTIETQR